jgi:hypothetical protein
MLFFILFVFVDFCADYYYIVSDEVVSDNCDLSSPCSDLSVLMKAKVNIGGKDSIVFLDKGVHDYSYGWGGTTILIPGTTCYRSVTFTLSGYSSDSNYHFSVNKNDISTYPVVNSIFTTSSSYQYLFWLHSDCNCAFEYLRLNFDKTASSRQTFIYSFFLIFFFFFFFFFFILLGSFYSNICKITNCVFSSDISDILSRNYIEMYAGNFVLTNSIFYFFLFIFFLSFIVLSCFV